MNLNLHWGRTLQNKAVQLRHRSQYNLSNYAYNYSDYKQLAAAGGGGDIYPWRINYTGSGNGSIMHAENQFLKKSRILTDLIDNTVKSHSFTTVVTIASVFLFLTMTITAAVVVFCKKKNTVFSLQKSEQEDDGEYELDDMPTDVEYTETDYNTESDTESVKHKRSPANLRRMAERRTHRMQQREAGLLEGETSTSSSRRPLVADSGRGALNESEAEDSPVPMKHVCRCGADPRGAYQRMVVTAILEKPHNQGAAGAGGGGGRGVGGGGGAGGGGSESGDSDTELRTKYIEKLRKHYYALAQTASSDIESENEGCPISKPPIINVTYVDEPPAYDCLDYKLPKSDIPPPQVVVDIEDYKPPQVPAFSVVDVHRADSPVDYTYTASEKKSDIPIMFVELPAPREKKEPPDGASVVFVELPPKPQQQKQQQSDNQNNNNGGVRMSSTSVVMHNGDTDVCLNGATSSSARSPSPSDCTTNNAPYPRMQLCSGSEGFPSPSMPLCSTGSDGFAVPTLAIIPPTPMSDSRPEDSVLLMYIDDEEESDYNEEEHTCKCLIEDGASSQ